MFQRHGDHVDTDDEGDGEVQVVAGAEVVYDLSDVAVTGVVGQLLSLCSHKREKKERRKREESHVEKTRPQKEESSNSASE